VQINISAISRFVKMLIKKEATKIGDLSPIDYDKN